MGDTSETNTKVLSREWFLGVVALKRLYRKIIICAIRSLFPNPVTYVDQDEYGGSRFVCPIIMLILRVKINTLCTQFQFDRILLFKLDDLKT